MVALKNLLKTKLNVRELENLRTSYDLIGDIAIIEIPRQLVRKQRIIAEAMRKLHPNVRVVAKKKGGHIGRYRTQPLQVLSGKRPLVTQHTESGVRFQVDVEKCYFSPRLSTERMRIARLVRPAERVLVMFSGIAAYPCILAKHTPAKKIVGVEINPAAHAYARINRKQNKMEARIELIRGDARRIVPTLNKFDRIIMPLPKGALKYLGTALQASKKGTVLHVYLFAKEGAFAQTESRVLAECAKFKKKCLIQNIVRAGQHAPRAYRICVDIRITGSSVR